MRVLAVTSVKNEGAFLLEWLAHHRAIGFTDFLVFSNDCLDGTDAILDRLSDLGWLTHVPNPGPWKEGPQWAALKQADAHPLKTEADWIAVIDVDEFVTIKTGDGTIPALLAAVPEATAFALTWRLFGNCGVVGYQDRPVTEQFPRCAPAAMRWPWRGSMFKTLFANDGTYAKLGVHRPRAPQAERVERAHWVDGSGRALPAHYRSDKLFTPPGSAPYDLVQLNHYALGAMESYVVKCDRGRSNRQLGPFDMSYWVERNFCAETEDSIRRYDSPAGAIRAELMADPELARLHQTAVEWRRERFRTLILDEAYRALFGRLLLSPTSQPLSERAEALMIGLAQRGLAAKSATIRNK